MDVLGSDLPSIAQGLCPMEFSLPAAWGFAQSITNECVSIELTERMSSVGWFLKGRLTQ